MSRAHTPTVTMLAVLAAVLLLALVPGADLAVFGLHEHVEGAEHDGDLAGPDSPQSATPFHHCELSASSAEVAPVVDLPTPGLMGLEPIQALTAVQRHRPFVPLPPPRA